MAPAAVDLYWLPLGAGGHFVRTCGRVYEALAARLQRRRPRDLYHAALHVELPEGTFVIEQAPVHDWSGGERGVVAEGAVGARWAGRFRIFRYEIRLWRDGQIPDVAEAVVRTITHAITEFEFHISPPSRSSPRRVGVRRGGGQVSRSPAGGTWEQHDVSSGWPTRSYTQHPQCAQHASDAQDTPHRPGGDGLARGRSELIEVA
jgi:hypothetical protein